MLNGTIKTHGHTSSEGKLDLRLDVGLPDTDVVVIAHVRPVPQASDLDENRWPKNFFVTGWLHARIATLGSRQP